MSFFKQYGGWIASLVLVCLWGLSMKQNDILATKYTNLYEAHKEISVDYVKMGKEYEKLVEKVADTLQPAKINPNEPILEQRKAEAKFVLP